MRGVWGHHLLLLFSVLVLVQCHLGCGVATAGTAIPVLASGQFWPSLSPGTFTTGVTCRGGEGRDAFFDAISIALAMVQECFGG